MSASSILLPHHLLCLCLLLLSPPPAIALNLNAVERVLLLPRLNSVRIAFRETFDDVVAPSLFGARAQPSSSSSSSNPNSGGDIGDDIVLIFPGAGGPDILTAELESALKSWDISVGELTTPRRVATVDWSEYTGSLLTAAYESETVGEACAEALWGRYDESSSSAGEKRGEGEGEAAVARRPPPRSVHAIGISVGGFAASSFARETCRLRDDERSAADRGEDLGGGGRSGNGHRATYVRLTLLDPFTSRGITGSRYGPTNFGRDVDFAEQYLNTDDPVPTTNDPLPLCHCVDVTGSAFREAFIPPEGDSMHSWPLAYYSRFGWEEGASVVVDERGGGGGERLVGLPTHGRGRERGSVVFRK